MTTMYTLRTPDGTVYGPIGMATVVSWAHERRVPAGTVLIETDGTERPISDLPEVMRAINDVPPMVPVPIAASAPRNDGGVSTLIPYRNLPALVGYYMSIASLLGIFVMPVGVLISAPALVLGTIGLSKRLREPEAKGTAHAWVAIILGGLMTLLHLAAGVFFVVVLVNA